MGRVVQGRVAQDSMLASTSAVRRTGLLLLCCVTIIMTKLKGCCATGAGQGIGRAFAHALGEAGASVAIVDINFKKAQEVTEELRTKGIRSIAVGTDVTKKADCKK